MRQAQDPQSSCSRFEVKFHHSNHEGGSTPVFKTPTEASILSHITISVQTNHFNILRE